MPRHTYRAASRGIASARFGVAGLLLIILASCGGASSTPPAAAASVKPSPTPFDVAGAFVKKMTSGAFTARSTVTGTIDEGPVHGTLDGTYTFSSGDYHYEINISVPGTRLTTHGTHIAGLTYKQEGSGPWLASTASPGGPAPGDLASQLTKVTSVTDVGLETKAGRQLHHLRPPGGLTIPPSSMGITDPDVRDATATVEIYAQDDGTLGALTMTMTWTQATTGGASVDAKMVLDFAFTNVGDVVTVTAPADVWQVFTSRRLPYTMAYPTDWATPSDPDGDFFRTADDSTEVWVYAASVPKGTTQTDVVLQVTTGVARSLNLRSDGRFAVEVGGVATTAYEYHGTINKLPTFFVIVPLLHAGKGYEIQWYSMPGDETADRGTLKEFLASFAFTK